VLAALIDPLSVSGLGLPRNLGGTQIVNQSWLRQRKTASCRILHANEEVGLEIPMAQFLVGQKK